MEVVSLVFVIWVWGLGVYGLRFMVWGVWSVAKTLFYRHPELTAIGRLVSGYNMREIQIKLDAEINSA